MLSRRKRVERLKLAPVKPEELTDAWWEEIAQKCVLTAAHRALLAAARQAWGRWTEIRLLIDRHGVLTTGRYKGALRVNPLLTAENRARESLVRILVHLDLESEEEGDDAG